MLRHRRFPIASLLRLLCPSRENGFASAPSTNTDSKFSALSSPLAVQTQPKFGSRYTAVLKVTPSSSSVSFPRAWALRSRPLSALLRAVAHMATVDIASSSASIKLKSSKQQRSHPQVASLHGYRRIAKRPTPLHRSQALLLFPTRHSTQTNLTNRLIPATLTTPRHDGNLSLRRVATAFHRQSAG